jgi:hypothetical protein
MVKKQKQHIFGNNQPEIFIFWIKILRLSQGIALEPLSVASPPTIQVLYLFKSLSTPKSTYEPMKSYETPHFCFVFHLEHDLPKLQMLGFNVRATAPGGTPVTTSSVFMRSLKAV